MLNNILLYFPPKLAIIKQINDEFFYRK